MHDDVPCIGHNMHRHIRHIMHEVIRHIKLKYSPRDSKSRMGINGNLKKKISWDLYTFIEENGIWKRNGLDVDSCIPKV